MGRLVFLLSILITTSAFAQFERDIFRCQSRVQGFENFEITQALPEGSLEAVYFLKVDATQEVWKQEGKAQLSSNEVPLFSSQFTIQRAPPPLPLPTPENPNPQPPEDDDSAPLRYAFVSINASGSGSISVKGDLAPLFCLKLF